MSSAQLVPFSAHPCETASSGARRRRAAAEDAAAAAEEEAERLRGDNEALQADKARLSDELARAEERAAEATAAAAAAAKAGGGGGAEHEKMKQQLAVRPTPCLLPCVPGPQRRAKCAGVQEGAGRGQQGD